MKVFIIICEGKSENNYLQMLNRFLREKEIDIFFKPKEVGTGFYNEVEKIYKKEHKNNKKTNIEIWVDNDIYKRNEKESMINYNNKPKTIPDFKFNYFNFEDFLAMHLEDKLFDKWKTICEKENHFNTPLYSEKYLPLFREHIFHDYKKGDIFTTLDKEKLDNLFKRNNDKNSKIKSDFAKFLEETLKEKIFI